MPGIRPYQPTEERNEPLDETVAWVGVLALFSEMTRAQRATFICHMGDMLYRLRSSDIHHLESRERVLCAIVRQHEMVEPDG